MTDQVELSKLFMAIAQATGKEVSQSHMRAAFFGHRVMELALAENSGGEDKLTVAEILEVLVDIIGFLLFKLTKDEQSRRQAATLLAMKLIASRVSHKDFDELSRQVDEKLEGKGGKS